MVQGFAKAPREVIQSDLNQDYDSYREVRVVNLQLVISIVTIPYSGYN